MYREARTPSGAWVCHMSAVLLAASVGVPFLLWVAACVPSWRRTVSLTLPIAPLPALAAALLSTPGASVPLPWLMLGGSWALDDTRRPLLAAMALVWCIGGWFALESPSLATKRCDVAWPWLFSLVGNVWLALAMDIGGFYSGFAMMSFGAYALIVLGDGVHTRAAGKRYLIYTVIGEMALLVGLLGASIAGAGHVLRDVPSAVAASPHALWITLALLIGFGVKAALFGVHGWLRMTYAMAPAPVRVVLGGAMINAGVLGWLLTLPIGLITLDPLGTWLILLGLFAAIFGAARGLPLGHAPFVLGWSSVSQIGLLTVLLGAALASGNAGFLPVITLYAAHHGVAKGALFAGSDETMPVRSASRRWLLLPALALAGAPFTSGAAAKLAMKAEMALIDLTWADPWLSVAAVGTTLLMVRVLWCTERMAGDSARTPIAWWLALGAVATGVWWWPLADAVQSGAHYVVALGWPIAVGVALGAVGWSRYTPAPTVFGQRSVIHSRDDRAPATSKDSAVSPTATRTAGAERASVWDARLRSAIPVLLGVLLLVVVAALRARAT
jgi:hydrogenase-4 component B